MAGQGWQRVSHLSYLNPPGKGGVLQLLAGSVAQQVQDGGQVQIGLRSDGQLGC